MDSKEKQINSENINKETFNNEEIKNDNQSMGFEDDSYNFGWNSYSEKINGRFAMLGFLAIILIELISQQSFLNWAGIL